MANKKDVYNAFYEGVCTVLTDLVVSSSGVNPRELDIDLDELREFCEENEMYYHIAEWIYGCD